MRVTVISLYVRRPRNSCCFAPRVDSEESALMDRAVIATRDPDRWQGREVLYAEEADGHALADGRRTIEDIACYQVRVQSRREDGAIRTSPLDWCDY